MQHFIACREASARPSTYTVMDQSISHATMWCLTYLSLVAALQRAGVLQLGHSCRWPLLQTRPTSKVTEVWYVLPRWVKDAIPAGRIG